MNSEWLFSFSLEGRSFRLVHREAASESDLRNAAPEDAAWLRLAAGLGSELEAPWDRDPTLWRGVIDALELDAVNRVQLREVSERLRWELESGRLLLVDLDRLDEKSNLWDFSTLDLTHAIEQSPLAKSVAAPAAAARPPHAEPVAAAPPAVESAIKHIDQARQAATLIAAARAGIPFCEECARAAAAA